MKWKQTTDSALSEAWRASRGGWFAVIVRSKLPGHKVTWRVFRRKGEAVTMTIEAASVAAAMREAGAILSSRKK